MCESVGPQRVCMYGSQCGSLCGCILCIHMTSMETPLIVHNLDQLWSFHGNCASQVGLAVSQRLWSGPPDGRWCGCGSGFNPGQIWPWWGSAAPDRLPNPFHSLQPAERTERTYQISPLIPMKFDKPIFHRELLYALLSWTWAHFRWTTWHPKVLYVKK